MSSLDWLRWFMAVYFVSLIMNWGVQLAYYFWKTRQNSQAFKGQRTLLNYYTGYLGDGIIVPLINILIFYVSLKIGLTINIYEITVLMILSIIIDILAHYLQGRFNLVNWSMPKPFVWNGAGYWHMISFPIQIVYILLFVYIIITHFSLLMSSPNLLTTTLGVVSLMAVFVVLFVKDNHWV